MGNHYTNRKFVLGGLVVFVAVVFLVKLFVIQIANPKYKLSANSNSRQRQVEYPARGHISDRYGNVLVYNEPAYELNVIPGQTTVFDTLELCNLLNVSKESLEVGLAKARRYSRIRATPIITQLSVEDYARLQEKMFKFPGFFVQNRAQRAYKVEAAPHVLGYIGEVSPDILKQDAYYSSGDYLGISGLENQYENILRGEKGVKFLLVDVYHRRQGAYENGRYDTLAVPGTNIQISLDTELQVYGERLLEGKKGSIVAIEPSTGEILALVSTPGFKPSDLVGRLRNEKYKAIQSDSLKPFFNRATMSRYAPGSIFKIVQALIGLEEGVINERTGFECNKNLIGCHDHPEATDVKKAIQYSCNPYFYQVYKRIIQQGKFSNIFLDSEVGIDIWRKHVLSFGLGIELPVDIPSVKGGFIPDAAFYDKWYGQRRWAFSTIYSNSNGQGEIESVPIQVANLAAIIANRGYYITPHFIKGFGDGQPIPEEYKRVNYSSVSPEFFDIAVDAMYDVVWEPYGTGRRARIPGISVCGKTGTVENDHGEDHSGFFAFAPKENPKIAIAVYVENAGGGGEWAAPISSLMIEKYLNGEVKQFEKEARILELRMF
jgi:penicillin-binding protein 2